MLSALVIIAASSFHFELAAQMMVKKDSCGIVYDAEGLRKRLAQGSVADGVTFSEGLDIASRLAAALQNRVRSTVGEATYCNSIR